MEGSDHLGRRYYSIRDAIAASGLSVADILELGALEKINLVIDSGLLSQVKGKWIQVPPHGIELTLRSLSRSENPLSIPIQPLPKYVYYFEGKGFDDYCGRYDKIFAAQVEVGDLWLPKTCLEFIRGQNAKRYNFRNWQVGEQRITLRDEVQAKIACYLWRQAKRGYPEQHEETIVTNIGLPPSKTKHLRDFFAKGKHPAWETLIQKCKPATYRIARAAIPSVE